MGRDDLLGEMPASCHYRPEGSGDSQWIVGLWEYHRLIQEPTWPLPEDPLYPEAVMRGLTTAVPGLGAYLDHLPQPIVDGGYYTKTRDNRPLVTRLGPEGSFLVGAFSGFGVMAAAAAAELAATLITDGDAPDYASAFSLNRYQDPAYLATLERESRHRSDLDSDAWMPGSAPILPFAPRNSASKGFSKLSERSPHPKAPTSN